MYPILGEVFGVAVRSYGLLCLVGIVAGVAVVVRGGARAGLDRRRLLDAALIALVGGLVGSKLLLIAVDAPQYAAEPWVWVDLFGEPRRLPSVLVVWQGGLVYVGGLLGGALAGVVACRRRGIDLGGFADAVAPGLSLGHVWGRFGCFLAGCCFGKAGGGPLGAAFPEGSQAYEAHAAAGLLEPPFDRTYPLHPTQLYDAGAELLIAALLLFVVAPRRRFRGEVAVAYLAAYSAARFVVELFRGDRARGFVGEPVAVPWLNHALGMDGGSPDFLSTSQAGAVLGLLVCAFIWLVTLQRRARQTGR